MGNNNSVWDRFDDIASENEVEEAAAQALPLEEGTYEMTLEEVKPDENKEGLPRLTGRFRIAATNKAVFYNQNLQIPAYPSMTPMLIGQAVAFVKGLLDTEYKFTGLSALANVVAGIEAGGIYSIKVTKNKKGYNELEILEKL